MASSSRFLSRLATFLLLFLGSLSTWADQGRELFEDRCASCHSIGGGDGSGPDLQGATTRRPAEWLLRIILEPDKLSADKDPVQGKLVTQFGYEMPSQDLAQAEAQAILAYLGSATGAGAGAKAGSDSEAMETMASPELIAAGRAFFTGSRALSKGGAPCLSCHAFAALGSAGGHVSVADLGQSYQRMGDRGMKGALATLSFPTMKGIFADRPLSEEEISALLAIFKDSVADKDSVAGISPSLVFPLAGGGVFALLLLVLAIIKRRIS
ncbi:MAG: cytochrome c [Spirochaetota bacterium]